MRSASRARSRTASAIRPTIYDIQWHNIQEGVQLTPLVLPASLNIGNAFSRGFEIGDRRAADRHLSAQLDYTYDQTRLTSLNPLFVYQRVGAAAGDRQPAAGHTQNQRGPDARARADRLPWR